MAIEGLCRNGRTHIESRRKLKDIRLYIARIITLKVIVKSNVFISSIVFVYIKITYQRQMIRKAYSWYIYFLDIQAPAGKKIIEFQPWCSTWERRSFQMIPCFETCGPHKWFYL